MERMYTVEEVAQILNLSKMTVRTYIKCDQLKANKIGRRYRIKQEDLNYFIEHGTTEDYGEKLKVYLKRI